MAACSTSIPDCGLTCEELECQLNAINLNITNLFNRTDDLNEFIGNNTWVIVTTDDELNAALPDGGVIFIRGTITRALGNSIAWTVSVPGTKLVGLPDANQAFAKVVNPHSVSAGRTVFNVATTDVEIRNLEITTNHPLTLDTGIADVGIVTFGAVAPYNTSGLVIDNCKIHHVTTPIKRASGNALPVQARPRITNNHIYSFGGYGIELDWGMDCLLIDNNVIEGRVTGDTHTNGNGIWIGNGCDNATIRDNKIFALDRHAIEYWHSLAGQNINCLITDNIIDDCVYGISAIGNGVIKITDNIIEDAQGIGIEIFGQAQSQSRYIVTGNDVKQVRFHVGQAVETLGMSIEEVNSRSIVANNSFGVLESPPGLDTFGIQIIGGCTNVSIVENTFEDCGTRMIFINGSGEPYNRINISNNEFYFSPDYSTVYPISTDGNFYAIHIRDVDVVSVKDNKIWFPTAEPTLGQMVLEAGGTVYTGDSTDAPIVSPGTMEESNLRIPY